jgi:hypothetical protein
MNREDRDGYREKIFKKHWKHPDHSFKKKSIRYIIGELESVINQPFFNVNDKDKIYLPQIFNSLNEYLKELT